ncbi:hypothetical protein OROMI_025080 [Orobanche minor]
MDNRGGRKVVDGCEKDKVVSTTTIHVTMKKYQDQTICYEISSLVEPSSGTKKQKVPGNFPVGKETKGPKSSHLSNASSLRSDTNAGNPKQVAQTSRKRRKCFNCNNQGHVLTNCPSSPLTCLKCGCEGHRWKYCEIISKLNKKRHPSNEQRKSPEISQIPISPSEKLEVVM